MLKFAAAQCIVRAGDIQENIRRHLLFMKSAHGFGVRFLLFPELSLTGYELELAQKLAQPMDTALITSLREYACEANMTTVVGLPLQSDNGARPCIAAFVLHADGDLTIYTKQHLHAGEADYFSPGQGGDLLGIDGIPTALCICADFSEASHVASAAQKGAQLYAASVLIGDSGYGTDAAILKTYAHKHRMAVLMANHGGPTGGWPAAGRSCFWNEDGQVIATTSGPGDQLLIVSSDNGVWTSGGQYAIEKQSGDLI